MLADFTVAPAYACVNTDAVEELGLGRAGPKRNRRGRRGAGQVYDRECGRERGAKHAPQGGVVLHEDSHHAAHANPAYRTIPWLFGIAPRSPLAASEYATP